MLQGSLRGPCMHFIYNSWLVYSILIFPWDLAKCLVRSARDAGSIPVGDRVSFPELGPKTKSTRVWVEVGSLRKRW